MTIIGAFTPTVFFENGKIIWLELRVNDCLSYMQSKEKLVLYTRGHKLKVKDSLNFNHTIVLLIYESGQTFAPMDRISVDLYDYWR